MKIAPYIPNPLINNQGALWGILSPDVDRAYPGDIVDF